MHLGEGTHFNDGRKNTLEEFYFDDKFSEFLEFYTKGKYADYDVEIIFNGDIFNMLQVDYEGHVLSVITEAVSINKIKKILDGHKRFFSSLKEFAKKEGNSITYIVGNHDQGVLWPGVRAYVDDALETKVRYKNIVYFFDGVHIEHGHMYEAANRLDPRRFFLKKNLPEPILNLPFGSHFFLELVMKIKTWYPHVDKIRPFGKMVKWLLFHETMVTIKAFFHLVFYFFKYSIKTKSRKGSSIIQAVKILLESAAYPDLGSAAKKVLSDSRVHTVIFGHSHVYTYRQFGAEQEYFNTGTWTEVTSLDISSLGRLTKLTYVLLEYNEEGNVSGRLKEWKGYHRIEEDLAIA